MLRIQPDVYVAQGSAAIYETVKAALLLVPRFEMLPGLTIKVVVIVPDTLMNEMVHMRAPYDDPAQRDLMTFMLDALKHLGLHSFTHDDEDEIAEAEHDAKVLDLLRQHSSAHMIGMERVEVCGVSCWRSK